jgi:hypothetical protein
MPVTSKKPRFAAGEAVQCIETHCSGAVPGSPVFLVRCTLRGNHPAVVANPQYFAPINATTDEVEALRRDLYEVESPPALPHVRTPPPAALLDVDAVVPRGSVAGIVEGTRLDRNSPVVLSNPGWFVSVCPPGLTASEAFVALATCEHTRGDDSTVTVYAGQWVPRDHELVALHPHQFGIVAS